LAYGSDHCLRLRADGGSNLDLDPDEKRIV
jgi:hypothetical protein